jgi:hypothetical protein
MFDITLVNMVFGVVLLFFGRRLFWLFVGIAGFLAGMDIANRFYAGTDTIKLLIALLIGIAGAFLAILFYKAAVAIAGFFIGGYLAMHLMEYLAINPAQSVAWVPYVIGGIIGAILILLLLDWALIVLSSFAGATLIVHAIMLRHFNMSIVFVVLVIIGIMVQAGIFLAARSRPA